LTPALIELHKKFCISSSSANYFTPLDISPANPFNPVFNPPAALALIPFAHNLACFARTPYLVTGSILDSSIIATYYSAISSPVKVKNYVSSRSNAVI